MASIMVSAVAYVATFESTPAMGSSTRDTLKQRAQDAIDSLYDTPVTGSSFGENALSVYLAQCLGGDCTNMTDKLGRVLPEGAGFAIYISNGYETFPVYVTREPGGEAVTVTHLLEPAWSNSFVTTGMTQVNSNTDSLLTYSLPVFNSNVLSEGGSPLRVIVHATRTSDGANYTTTGFFSTQAVSVADATQYPAASMYFMADGKPAGMWNASAIAMPLSGPKNLTFQLRLEETAGVSIPAGTELTVSIPRGWTGGALASANPDWIILSNATSKNDSYAGSDVTARLLSDVTGMTRDFYFYGNYHGDKLEWYPFHARLAKGALSEANVLVRPTATAVDSGFAIPQVAMSLPRPMGATATTLWTLTVDIPATANEHATLPKTTVNTPNTGMRVSAQTNTPSATQESDQAAGVIVINSIEIIEQDGAAIFGAVTPVTGIGKWTNGKDRLTWNGSHANDRGPLALTFNVTGSGVAGAAGSKNPFVPPAQFEDHKGRLLTQIAPGLFRGVQLPGVHGSDYAGYGNDYGNVTSGDLDPDRIVRSDAIYRSTLLPGSTNYTINPVTSFQDSMHGSYLGVERRNVPVGGTAVLSADMQSLLFALSQAGISAGVNLHVYPPWAGDTRDPIYTQSNLDAGVLGSDVTQLMLQDMNNDGIPDVVVGTSNGRVLALHGMTGARLQGNAFTASLRTGATAGAVTGITHLVPFHHKGEDYVVVGTDKEGAAIYVLDKDLQLKWRYEKSSLATLALDASVDITGDDENDIIAGLDDSGVYVLVPPSDVDDASRTLLTTHRGANSDGVIANAFYTTLGKPTALVGMKGIGPNASRTGFGVSFQSTPGTTAFEVNWDSPLDTYIPDITIDMPRAGFQGVDQTGLPTWTFFGSPVGTALPYNYDQDAATDILAGSPAGFVFMMNGMVATQPLYSLIYPGGGVRDADGHDAFHQAYLGSDGGIHFTADGWIGQMCAFCSVSPVPSVLFPTAQGVALNGSYSFWAAGHPNLLLRSVPGIGADGEDQPQNPTLVVVTPNATRLGQPDYLTGKSYLFNDIDFGWGPTADHGFVIAGHCVEAGCEESLIMRTLDGGASWKVYALDDPVNTLRSYEDKMVRGELLRMNFTTESVGWIVGRAGTLLRTLDGGETWEGVKTPAGSQDILDISCAPKDPSHCMILTSKKVWIAENATSQDRLNVGWTPVELDLVATTAEVEAASQNVKPKTFYTKALKSIAYVDTQTAYIGAENMIMKTVDGGSNWTTMPMNYLESDAARIVALPDGRGFLYGGNSSHARVFFMHDYNIGSVAQTSSLLKVGTDERIAAVYLDTEYDSYVSEAVADLMVSADGGVHWERLDYMDETPGVRKEGNNSAYFDTATYRGAFIEENRGTDLRVQVLFSTNGDKTLNTAQLRSLHLDVLIENVNDAEVTREVSIDVDLKNPASVDAGNTSAHWDLAEGVIHQALADERWTRNVSGEVKTLATGYDVSGSAHNEVWVGTGGVLAMSSPEHVIYAGSDWDKWIKQDNRVYLLDGSNGTILARTASFAGNVTHITVGDNGDGGAPEHLYVTTWDPGRSQGTIEALNPVNLSSIWTADLGIYQPSDVQAGFSEGPYGAALVGTQASETGQNAISGKVYSIRGDDANINWGAIPDQLGRYLITKDIPASWLFGPYMVEMEVQWTSEVMGADGKTPTDSVLQKARFYDYFVVTPPDALSPPSPVYQVHLVTWFDDWR